MLFQQLQKVHNWENYSITDLLWGDFVFHLSCLYLSTSVPAMIFVVLSSAPNTLSTHVCSTDSSEQLLQLYFVVLLVLTS